MAEEPAGALSEHDLLLRAGFNFNVFLAAALGFARARGESAETFLAWTAERLAPTWAGLRGHGADAVLYLVLQNLASAGYPVEEYAYGADESTAIVGAIPLGLEPVQWQELLAPLGVAPEEMQALFRIFVPLAREAGCTLEAREEDGRIRLTARRLAPAS